MKLIHCSDLHLDSRMESNLTFSQARQRNHEILTTFSRMVSYGKEHGVRAILIAGDLFDTERISGPTADFILSTMERNPGMDFFYLRGNHDESRRAFAGRELPENLRLFGPSLKTCSYDDVTVSGLELNESNCRSFYGELDLDPEKTNILMLHGQISTQPGEEQICLPMLRDRHISYLALGHLHSYQTGRLDLTGTYCYCGCLEGRGFDECGEKGFVLVDTDAPLSETFVPFASRTLYDLPVDITGLTTVTEISRAMEAAAAGISSDSLVRFTLTGTYTPDTQKDLSFLRDTLSPSFYFVKIKDQSTLALPREDYQNDISLKGEFIRLVMASENDGPERDRIILSGLQALSGEEITL